ncbi:MAG: hypothetical protein PHQ80_02395 [Candidatus ainarchaeum sp.]|nr:hypothetical protein [Candidatus ainarchaeum sp.]MDD5096478.1 hypothetical protein [Candidatus ainarchaeum sp.]
MKAEPIPKNRDASAQRNAPEKPRRRAPMDDPHSPTARELARRLAEARSAPASMEQVVELSTLAVDFHRAGNGASSHGILLEALNAARSLPSHLHHDALSHVLLASRGSRMDTESYFTLLRMCGGQ